jgi:very-short-patch-repair endonuclease
VHSSMFLSLSVGLILVAAFVALTKGKRASRENDFAGRVMAAPLLNGAEIELHRRLCEAFPGRLILPQVALSQLVKLKSGAPRQIYFRYSQLVADFVICERDFRPLAVVELDGATHARASQAARDAKKDQVIAAAGLQMHRFSTRAMPTVAQLTATILFGATTEAPAAKGQRRLVGG